MSPGSKGRQPKNDSASAMSVMADAEVHQTSGTAPPRTALARSCSSPSSLCSPSDPSNSRSSSTTSHNSVLNTLKPTTVPNSNLGASSVLHALPTTALSHLPPLPPSPSSPAPSLRSIQAETSNPGQNTSRGENTQSDELVAPLLDSFASLHVEDGVAKAGEAGPSPPLCPPLDRATLLTKSGTNPYFVATVARVKETQDGLRRNVGRLDQDVVEARARAIHQLTSAMNILVRAQDKVDQQQSSMETDRNVAAELIDELDSKLHKAERDITTLRAKQAAVGLLEKMFSDIASLRTQDEDLRARALQTSDARIAMRGLTDEIATIIAQLLAHNTAARQYTYVPRPSFASDTSLEEHSGDSVSSSQSFGDVPSPHGLHFAKQQRGGASSQDHEDECGDEGEDEGEGEGEDKDQDEVEVEDENCKNGGCGGSLNGSHSSNESRDGSAVTRGDGKKNKSRTDEGNNRPRATSESAVACDNGSSGLSKSIPNHPFP
ncbi:hypothetical protein GSI_04714 [Ganoderma sinense ZZ0214-1]|uniref:Uncharacterized protein n=1 Tax=Ganoderma sinense ZZ0214-1 TaxID=1077348 RepID=A0A2G8SHL1_9APHY|nr:hypothetical protein GSI_04714 [Ganoderma sinense ZZ0214-1]